MYVFSNLIKVTIPNYLASLPIPDSIGGWFRLGVRDWLALIPPTAVVGGISYYSYQTIKKAQENTNKQINPEIRKDINKVVDFIDIEDITEKASLCRCWRSKNIKLLKNEANRQNHEYDDKSDSNARVTVTQVLIPRNCDGQIEEHTMAKLWAYQLDYNNFQAIQSLNVEQASSVMSSQNEISSILRLKETIMNPIKYQFKTLPADISATALRSTESVDNLFCHETILELEIENNESENNASVPNLACEETMPDSGEDNSFYEDSDDSVCDKDYVPSISSPSSDSSININKNTSLISSLPSKSAQKQLHHDMLNRPQNEQNCAEDKEVSQDTSVINIKNNQQTEGNIEYNEENRQGPESIRNETSLIQDLRPETEESNINKQNSDIQYTKKGTIRKRRKINTSLSERKKVKLEERELKQKIKSPCSQKCPKKCHNKFTQDARVNIHDRYLSLGWEAQGVMIKNLTSEIKVQSRKKINETNSYKRNKTYKYFLPTADGEKIEVCKTFFLTKLGYNKKNDKRLLKILQRDIANQKDKRGKHNNRHKINTENLETHVLSV